jgi:16S rRNA (uracil1498-N3)-methyltransferase
VITLLAPPGSLEAGATVSLGEEEARHLRARRAEDEETIRLVDGAGSVGWGDLLRAGQHLAAVINRVERVPRPVDLVLAVGAGDRERFGWVVEKATELGATEVVPLETARSLAVGPRVRPEGLDRLARRAREALKQCGRAWAPDVAPPMRLDDFLQRPVRGPRWLADPDGAAAGPLASTDRVTVAVGPEGGFTDGEQDRIGAAGFAPVRLADGILRYETAALAALALVGHLRGARSHE